MTQRRSLLTLQFADAAVSFAKQDVLSPASQSTEEEKDEESEFSEGQLVSTGCQSEDSETSEELTEGKRVSSGVTFEFSS